MNINIIKETAVNEYNRWLANTDNNRSVHEELLKLGGNEEEVIDSFYTHLSFGTSGMRGIIGPGTNRINEYVVRRATQGIADYLNLRIKEPSVVIAYDSRKNSSFYAHETAAVFKGNGIKTYLFSDIAPVSVLSYSITHLHCDMGIMITASHNPKIYNGYKVYNKHGYQIVGDEPELILEEIEKLDFFKDIKYENDGIIEVSDDVSREFIRDITAMTTRPGSDVLNNLKVIYTPLNGAGRRYVKDVFKGIGYENYNVVKVQEYPDENFTTCSIPNPERILSYDEAFRVLDSEGSDLIIATDPDSDRIGAAMYHDGMRTLLTGNQLGILMLDYLCQMRPPEEGQIVVKSIVTSPLAERVARKYGLNVINTLTGFKYIGEIVSKLRAENDLSRYYFGFEESNGYLISPFICDKDGVSGAMITVEMAAFYKAQGKDLMDRLNELYDELGLCVDKTRNYFFNGAEGVEKMNDIMAYFRKEVNDSIGGQRIAEKIDYMGNTGLPKANVLAFHLENGSSIVIRPSGTESKLKVYSFEGTDITSVEKDMIKIIEKFKRI